MKILLITGANGWLGKSIIKNLIDKESFFTEIDCLILHTLYKDDNFLNSDEIKFIKSQNIDLDFIEGAVQENYLSKNLNYFLNKRKASELRIIYTSSIIHPKKTSDFFDINYHGLKNFFSQLDKSILCKFTYISSNSPFGFSNKGYIFDEKANYKPIGGYGESKQLAEQYLLREDENNDFITILRAPWFHGNNMPDRQKSFLKKVSKGKFPLVGFGKNRRSIVNTYDLALAALNVTLMERKSKIYWIADRYSYTMESMIKIIQKEYALKFKLPLPKKRKYLFLPKGFSSFFCILDIVLQKLGLYNMYIHVFGELGQNIECSSERYRNEFKVHKWHELNISIHEELNEAFD